MSSAPFFNCTAGSLTPALLDSSEGPYYNTGGQIETCGGENIENQFQLSLDGQLGGPTVIALGTPTSNSSLPIDDLGPLLLIDDSDPVTGYYFSNTDVSIEGCTNGACNQGSNFCLDAGPGSGLVGVTLNNCTQSDLTLEVVQPGTNMTMTSNFVLPNGASTVMYMHSGKTLSFSGTNAPSGTFLVSSSDPTLAGGDNQIYINTDTNGGISSGPDAACIGSTGGTVSQNLPRDENPFVEFWWVWLLVILGVIIFIVFFIFIIRRI